ncbi:hypothetical protein CA13_20100 [Planctomycetes bacterium CA13]|uniref:Uncharacterized protein n=1 Tax=Novipirellula herctigrandis TaxID=2527986 RepID=A0A5C5YZS0_9BACT|nr:hypothetical protein CA13_20100 [Planctomycetes bacterium CA13]
MPDWEVKKLYLLTKKPPLALPFVCLLSPQQAGFLSVDLCFKRLNTTSDRWVICFFVNSDSLIQSTASFSNNLKVR